MKFHVQMCDCIRNTNTLPVCWIRTTNTCTNKSIVVRTKFGNSIRESNHVELCYDVDRGEIENVPELEQTVVETDGFVRYGISLSDNVVPKQNVQVRIRSVSDVLMNKIDKKMDTGAFLPPI